MNLAVILTVIYKSLDALHDYILHPIFKDEANEEDMKKILNKLEELEKEIKNKELNKK